MQYLKPCLPEFSGGRGRGKRGKVEGQEQVVGGGGVRKGKRPHSQSILCLYCAIQGKESFRCHRHTMYNQVNFSQNSIKNFDILWAYQMNGSKLRKRGPQLKIQGWSLCFILIIIDYRNMRAFVYSN